MGSKRIEIKLVDLFSKDYYEEYFNVIYAIKNLLDGRFYIGQAKDLMDRFRYNNNWSHKNKGLYIDNSIRYHGPENFIVIIIKYDLQVSDLDYWEMYYIRRLHTWDRDPWWDTHYKSKKQYNQDPGGHGEDKLWAMIDRSIEVREKLWDGDAAASMHDEDCYRRSAETRRRLYGSANACCNEPEVRKKANETNRRNHGGKLAWNYEGQTQDMMKTQRENHNGLLAFNTYKSYQLRIINRIEEISTLLQDHGFDLTPENYYKVNQLTGSNYVIDNHILNVCERIYDDPSIFLNPNWKSEWTLIFKWFDNQENWESLKLI